MPSDTFWSNTLGAPNPAVPVIEDPATEPNPADPNNPRTSYYVDPATGNLIDPAHRHIPGTAKGAVPDDYTQAARIVYPLFDGVNAQIMTDRPAALDDPTVTVTLGEFAGWHSSFQAEYLMQQPATPAPRRLVFPTNSALNQAQAIYRIGGDGMVYNLSAMTMTEYAQLSRADKFAFEQDLIDSGVATRLGLSRSALQLHRLIDSTISNIDGAAAMDQGNQDTFIEQLRILQRTLTPSTGTGTARTLLPDEPNLFSEDAITLKISDINERFLRALEFTSVPSPRFWPTVRNDPNEDGPTRTYFGKTGSYSSEGNLGSRPDKVGQGFEEMMRAERAILTMQTRREGIVGSTFGFDPKLDVPNLIYQLQLTYEAQNEGIADAGTELIRQLHALLQDYGVMQRIINDQIQIYDPEDADEELDFASLGSFSAKERYVLAMFATDSGANPDVAHPVESFFEIDRPREQFYDYQSISPPIGAGITYYYVNPVERRKNHWDQYSTQLADAVTLLNQRNQILQNDIENATKQQNRHFELGNNALRKMNDMLMTIGRM